MGAAKTPDMLEPGTLVEVPPEQVGAAKPRARRQRTTTPFATAPERNVQEEVHDVTQSSPPERPMAPSPVPLPPPSCEPTMPPEIAHAIIEVMKNIDPVQKKGRNTEHNYKFVAVEDLLKEIQPEMAKAGLLVMQFEKAIRTLFDGNFIEIEYQFGLFHESGVEWKERQTQTGLCRLRFKSGGYDDKAYNKCHTSARKYFLMGLFQIPTGDIADNDKADRRDTAPAADGETVQAPEPEEAMSAAKRWAKAALRSIGSFTELDPLRAWKAKYDATLAKLEETSPEDFKAVTDAFIAKCETFAPGAEEERDPDAPPF